MDCTFHYLPYQKTGYFTKIAVDYLQGDSKLQPFYNYPVSLDGIKRSIEARKQFATDRKLLVAELRNQYNGLNLTSKQEAHLQVLLSDHSFTITTAHQPNIFTGPLYFIYKIMHAIKLADELNTLLPSNKFVPVYYMGSEDADLDELGFINLQGQRISWNTQQTGAVGRMKVDKSFIQLIDLIYGQIGVHPYGAALTNLFKQSYTIGKTIQQATLELVNSLFADFGLLIVIPDNAALKRSFQSVVEKELKEQFSHKEVASTIEALSKHYKVQAGGRDINLFYFIDDKRERIEYSNSRFEVSGLKLSWTKDEILNELNQHPERFSANVILRGVFQETILPNIAFIGGGGELAYWLELKNVFAQVHVPYPMLILRNSFLWMNQAEVNSLKKFGFSIEDSFKNADVLLNELVKKESDKQLTINDEIVQIQKVYEQLSSIARNVDASLIDHTKSLQTKALKQLHTLEKKILRAEKRKFEAQERQLQKIKASLFPSNSLQERQENFSLLYAQFGKEWLQIIYTASKGLEQTFGVIVAN
jgi:bacillithiol biosynthesis cysteine-adding enzyme BshC